MTHDEMIAVIQVRKEGKQIEYSEIGKAEWKPITNPRFNFASFDYRIKTEPHYRPFKSAEEVMEAIEEHGLILRYKISPKNHGLVISQWNNSEVWVASDKGITHKGVFDAFIFADGTPFGALED